MSCRNWGLSLEVTFIWNHHQDSLQANRSALSQYYIIKNRHSPNITAIHYENKIWLIKGSENPNRSSNSKPVGFFFPTDTAETHLLVLWSTALIFLPFHYFQFLSGELYQVTAYCWNQGLSLTIESSFRIFLFIKSSFRQTGSDRFMVEDIMNITTGSCLSPLFYFCLITILFTLMPFTVENTPFAFSAQIIWNFLCE